MRCPMCHGLLDATAQAQACQSCPLYHLARGCRLQLIRCPTCGYHSLPGEERAPRQMLPAVEPLHMEDGAAPCPLNELAVGAQACLVGFDSLTERDLQRLMAYGLVPGARLKVLQRVPAYILKIYETELALEHSLVKAIYVHPDPSVDR